METFMHKSNVTVDLKYVESPRNWLLITLDLLPSIERKLVGTNLDKRLKWYFIVLGRSSVICMV